jgi:hypothetical protein
MPRPASLTLVRIASGDDNAPLSVERLPRVEHQVDQRRFELSPVQPRRPNDGAQICHHLDIHAGGWGDERFQAGDHFVWVHDFGLQHLLARKGQQLPGQLRPSMRGHHRHLQHAAGAVRQVLLAQRQIDSTGNHREQVVEIVRDPADKLPDRLEPLHPRELFTRLGELAVTDLRQCQRVRNIAVEAVRLEQQHGEHKAGRQQAVDPAGVEAEVEAARADDCRKCDVEHPGHHRHRQP